jgi:TolB-like protein
LSSWTGRPTSRQFEAVAKAIAAKAGERSSAIAGHRSGPAARIKRHWAVAAASAAALVLAAVGLVTTGVIESPWAALRAQTPAIAVLPFADLSPAHDKAYFAEGVAEEILSSLARDSGIKVLGRSSARQIESGVDPRDVRRKLGVTHLLEGSARSAGEQLRVNVRLIDTSDGRQVWEEEYQGKPGDIFVVQDQIAAAVVQRLKGTLARPNLRPRIPTNTETFQTYLAARGLMRTRSQKGLDEAFTLAQKVVRSDPHYAPGHALIAELYQMRSDDFRAYGTMPIEQARKFGIAHANQAIRLAPEAAEGYAALGMQMEGAASLQPLRRAIELDPSRGELHLWLGFSLDDLGRHDEALAQYRAGADIDPLGFVTVNRYIHALAAAGQAQKAIGVVRQFIARGGDQSLTPIFMMQIAMMRADLSETIAQGRKMLAPERVRHQYFRLFLAAPLYTLGRADEASRVLLPMQNLHVPYYRGDLQLLRRNIAERREGLWKRPDSVLAFVHLARLHDWNALAWLYDRRNLSVAEFCERRPNDAVPFVLALRAKGRAHEGQILLGCLRDRLALEFRNHARLPQDWPGDLEFRRAGLSALDGNRPDALGWLDRAVSRGWLGQPYSSRLTDYPQFDGLRADPRFAQLQRRIDVRIARERAELAAQERSAPLA